MISYQFRRRTDGAYPISPDQIRFTHRADVSFGPTVTPEIADALGYDLVQIQEQPDYDSNTHGLREAPPVFIHEVLTQQWEVFPLPAEEAAANQAAAIVQAREQAKAARAASVDAIKVTTAAGNTFDGDELSQGRMARAVIALSTGLAPSVTWVLADNTTIQATAAELTEALVLAGQAQAAIWVL